MSSLPPLTVSVTALAAFCREGDLDHRYAPGPSALEGMEGHRTVAGRRSGEWDTEVALELAHGPLLVRGRADAWSRTLATVEEVKTHKGSWERIPEAQQALHWSQARLYAHMLCVQHGLASIRVCLRYHDLLRDRDTVLERTCEARELATDFAALCARYTAWGEQEALHHEARTQALRTLAFPLARMRLGQRQLAENVYTAARRGRVLLAEAPTGVGKTLGTVFPMLKAMGEDLVDRLFFLTAKTTGRTLALDALATVRQASSPAIPLRALELSAKDRVCPHPGTPCLGATCPLAQGFYDRLPAARQAAIDAAAGAVLDRQTLQTLADAHAICPYYLTQELVQWADMVVCDYHYHFDTTALLPALTQQEGWRTAMLVDEAHNLVDRARDMYSAALQAGDLRRLQRSLPTPLRRAVGSVRKEWNRVMAHARPGYQTCEPDDALHARIQDLVARITRHLADAPEALAGEALDAFFMLVAYAGAIERFGPHSIADLVCPADVPPPADLAGAAPERSVRGFLPGTLTLRNVIPAPFVQERLRHAHCAVLFSATLRPMDFYADMLGLPASHVRLQAPSPFRADQLQVDILPLSTRWQDREASVAPLVQAMAARLAARPGNYLAFFSSFRYLDAARAHLTATHPDLPVWTQTPGMDDAARAAFLHRFQPGGSGIGFAVLGGAFGEGVDLPGERLIGAFVATLGLPPVDPVHEAMRRTVQQALGHGFDYVYLYPGLRKVIQACGRVVRTESDAGSLLLVDDRYRDLARRGLLPSWWGLAPV